MITHKITDTTLADIVEIGNRMAQDGQWLEKLIWQIKAEAYQQLDDAALAYSAAMKNTSPTDELVQACNDASARVATLAKLWKQAVDVRNRAVQFGQIDERRTSSYVALSEVFETRKDRD